MPSPADAGTAPGRRIPGRSFLTWTLGYGMAGASFRGAARGGDLIARLETERDLQVDPWATYDELRSRGHVAAGKVAYATASHAGVTEVLRSNQVSTAGDRGELPGPLGRLYARTVDPWSATVVDPPSMLATDAPDHTRYRKLVSRAFTARAIGGLEDRIQGVADGLLDRLSGRGDERLDLIEEYAALLPVAIIADMLGVPDEMHASLLEWGNGAAATLDPTLGWRSFRRADADMRHLHRWFATHVAELRRDPGDDLLSRLLEAQEDDEQPLTDAELRATGLLVLGAGFETTVNLIGNAVQQLSAHPEQRERALADESLWGNVVEETLRYDSPVQVTMRLPKVDLDVLGSPAPRGVPVLCYLGGANRDPDVFADPHVFDVGRTNAGDHVSFSSGAHFCLGASLARKEAVIALRSLYARYPDLDVVRPPKRRPTRVLRGYEHLPVVLGSRSRAGAAT